MPKIGTMFANIGIMHLHQPEAPMVDTLGFVSPARGLPVKAWHGQQPVQCDGMAAPGTWLLLACTLATPSQPRRLP